MTGVVPPGWPKEVRPPGSKGWEKTAVAWLLDLCPSEYRSYDVLRRHPLVLARFTAHHVEGAISASRTAYSRMRAELGHAVTPEVLTEALNACERDGARLVAAQRAVGLVEEALQGRQFRARL